MPKQNKNILVADDEPGILEVVAALFESKGFDVFTAPDGARALDIFNAENLALVILDLMMPRVSGEEVCRVIRKKSRVPVIMLTAKVEELEIVSGLELGADDYVTKPFSMKELYARAEAVMRRSRDDIAPLTKHSSWRNGDLVIDFEKNIVLKRGAAVPLTPNEHRILAALVKHPGRVFSRDDIIEFALPEEFDGYDRAVDSHIKNLRKKIEDNSRNPVYVLTVHGLGYKFGGE